MWEGLERYGLLLSAFSSFVLGFMVVVWYVALQQAKRLINVSPLQPIKNGCGLKQIPTPRAETTRSSGSPQVDEEVERIITLCLRDYLQSWYHPLLNGDTAILQEARSTSGYVVSVIGKRCSEPEFLPLFMENLVNILIDHLHLYKTAVPYVTNDKPLEKCLYECDSEPGWSIICSGGEPKKAYVRGVTELVLCLLLPQRDFKNPLFRSLAEDLIVEQVFLPTVHYVTTPHYVNSTLVYLAKESSFNGESLLIGLSNASAEEVIISLNMANEEINRIKRKGTTEEDHLQLSSLSELASYLSRMKETGIQEANKEQFREQFPTLIVSIPEHRLVSEGRTTHAEYRILVGCQHRQGPMEEWVTYRRFADLHDLHLSLKESSIPASELPKLPSQTKAFNKLDPSFLEVKKAGMESYLKKISSQEFLNQYPHAFQYVILFLTESSYVRHSTEIARTVDKLVQPLRRTKSESTKTPSPNPYRKMDPSYSIEEVEEDEVEVEDEDEGGVAILLTLLDEVFDVKEGDQWLQRRLTHLLRQLLASMLSDKMGKRMMETLDSFATADRIAGLIADLRQSLWPDGYQAKPRDPPPPELIHLTTLVARCKLSGSIPDDLRRLLGSVTIKKGVFRLFNMFQHQTFNSRLVFRIIEALICSLYPERDLAQAFKNLRTQIKINFKPLQ